MIALEEYVRAINLTTDREGSLRTRLGSSLLSLPVGVSTETDVHTLARLKGVSNAYRYALSSINLFRAESPYTSYYPIVVGGAWLPGRSYEVGDIVNPSNGNFYRVTRAGTSGPASPLFSTSPDITDGTVKWAYASFSGNPILTVDYAIGADVVPWEIFADAHVMVKDYGLGQPVLFGILPPAHIATSEINVTQAKPIEDFQAATPGAYWTTTGAVTLTAPAAPEPYHGNPTTGALALLASIGGATTVTITKAKSLDLDDFGTIQITDADFVHLYVNTNNPENITEILIQLSIGDDSFEERYEKAVGPSNLQAGMDFTSSTHTATTGTVLQDSQSDAFGGRADLENDNNTNAQYSVVDLEPGANIWSELSIPRGEFSRVASTDSLNNWGNVEAIRLKIKTAGSVNIYFDDWAMTGGGALDGFIYYWKYVYRNSTTGQMSNPSQVSGDLSVAPSRQSMSIRGHYSRDPQVDQIDFYRLGGTATAYRYAGSIDNLFASAAEFVFVDNTNDSALGAIMETDNDRPPNFTGIELHNETIFGWGAVTDPPNMIRFSKKVFVESFPQPQHLYVGSGGDKVVRCIASGQQLIVFTLSEVYMIIGTGPESYQAISTGYGRGMIDNAFALSASPGSVYHLHYDGIYMYPSGKKVSEPIDGVFHSQFINGIAPLNLAALNNVRLQFYDNKLHVLYPTLENIFPNREMVLDINYDRWMPSDRVGRSMIYERDSSLLLMGTVEGLIYQLEVGANDAGTPISIDMQTKFLDLGVPDQQKTWADMALDIDTLGQVVYVQLNYNNGDLMGLPLAVSTASRSMIQIPINDGDGIQALNCQISIIATVPFPVTMYKAIFRVLVEPPCRRTYVTDWTDDGYPGMKEYRTLMLELDSGPGAGVNIEVQIDGATVSRETFTTLTAGRQLKYFGMAEGTKGALRRLKFTQVTDSPNACLKVYADKMDFHPQPVAPEIWQTEWTENGYPYDKYWKEVLLEIDTYAGSRQVALQIDGVTRYTFHVFANGRQRITTSMPADIIGKLGRLVITGGPTMLYAATYVTDNDPPDVTRADSLDQTFGIERWKQGRRCWFSLKATSDISVSVYCDEVLRATATIPASMLLTGWAKFPVTFPPHKGKLIRYILTSPTAFKIYWEQSLAEIKPVGGQIGYSSYKFSPPQMM